MTSGCGTPSALLRREAQAGRTTAAEGAELPHHVSWLRRHCAANLGSWSVRCHCIVARALTMQDRSPESRVRWMWAKRCSRGRARPLTVFCDRGADPSIRTDPGSGAIALSVGHRQMMASSLRPRAWIPDVRRVRMRELPVHMGRRRQGCVRWTTTSTDASPAASARDRRSAGSGHSTMRASTRAGRQR